jgi:adenylate cyclase
VPVQRKLAAIFAADIAGYSRLMARDEVGTLARLKACRVIVDGLIASHRGRIFNTAGDSVVADFASAVDAVQCAVAVQAAIATENATGTADELMQFRIGLHVGDVMVDGENLLGDGVNIAARLEALAEPGAICVSAVVHDQVGNKLPVRFDDLGDQQVKNIAQAIRVYRVQMEKSAAQPVAALPLPDKPSIAVLPFQNMSGDPEQEYFVDGMVEEITTALSRVGGFFVIARNSSFAYKGKAINVTQVGRELGVRYVLEGSLRKAGNRVRITGQLIEAATGHHIWADRFDGALDDIFDLQDRITENVVGSIAPNLRRAEFARAYAKPTANLDAHDFYLRALERHYLRTRPTSDAAVELLKRAIALDPDYAQAKACLAEVHAWRSTAGWSAPEEPAIAIALAREALASNRDDPDTLRLAAHALSFFARDYDVASATITRATKLYPDSAQVLAAGGWINLHCCNAEAAVECFQRAMRLSPLDQEMGLMLWGLCLGHLMARRNDEALACGQAAVREMPNYSPAHRFLAFALVRLGRIDEAREAMSRVLQLDPGWSLSRRSNPFRDQGFFDEGSAAFLAAGAPL